MKQTIEIEVPDGKKAVWKNGKIEFIDVSIIELLKGSADPEKAIFGLILKELCTKENSKLANLYDLYKSNIPNKYARAFIKLKLFLTYLNKDHEFGLISGEVHYPYVKFYLENKFPKNRTAIGRFRYKENIYVLVNEQMYSETGLVYSPSCEVGSSITTCSFLACKDRETAQFVATTFGKLIFEVLFGNLIDYEWI